MKVRRRRLNSPRDNLSFARVDNAQTDRSDLELLGRHCCSSGEDWTAHAYQARPKRKWISPASVGSGPQACRAVKMGKTRSRDFQQANKLDTRPQFLQIVAKPDRPTPRKTKHKLSRVAFRVSRLMEFCTKRELQNQTGHRSMIGRWSCSRKSWTMRWMRVRRPRSLR